MKSKFRLYSLARFSHSVMVEENATDFDSVADDIVKNIQRAVDNLPTVCDKRIYKRGDNQVLFFALDQRDDRGENFIIKSSQTFDAIRHSLKEWMKWTLELRLQDQELKEEMVDLSVEVELEDDDNYWCAGMGVSVIVSDDKRSRIDLLVDFVGTDLFGKEVEDKEEAK